MTKTALTAAALLLPALPALAQAKPLTPPDVLGAAKTIQFTATLMKEDKAAEVSTAVLAQPNKAAVVDTKISSKAPNLVYVSDGTVQTEYSASLARYTKTNAPADLTDTTSETLALSTLTRFLAPEAFAQFHHATSHSNVSGVDFYERPLETQAGKTETEVLAVNSVTGLPESLSVVVTSSQAPARTPLQVKFSAWNLNAPVPDTAFAYTPPASATLYVAPVVLMNGMTAPNFTVQDKDGNAVKLSDYRGKTVVLDFWATWCGPCQRSLPHTTETAKKYAGKNVVVLAINVWDTPAAFHGWLPKHPEYAPLHFAIDSAPTNLSVATALYGVNSIPTQYVIGPNGKIVKSIVGYEMGDTQLEDALKTVAGN